MRILVVGQGLAGTLVSHFALLKGWDCHVIDSHSPSASSVAAGMFNPMSFRRIIEVWDADLHLNAMSQTYRALETILETKLLHFLPIVKCIPNAQYAADWNRKSESLKWIEPIQNQIDSHLRHDKRPPNHEFGLGLVRGGGWLNLPELIKIWRSHLQKLNRFESRTWAFDDVHSAATKWDAIVDCRGIAAAHDSINGMRMDIRANRGEILTVSSTQVPYPAEPSDHILNFGKWLLPVGPNTWRLGASYEWNRNDLHATPETADFMLDAAHEALGVQEGFQIVQHQVGIRPVSRDRRPVVGKISDRDRLYALNGLGTRGVLIAPRWAEILVDCIKGDTQIPDNVIADRIKIPH